ncbi:MAG: response regulator transcription factor [Sphingobacteriales bacterium]|nr:MAG: response regulator transcription factor [Sphingobacteriales bacterium]
MNGQATVIIADDHKMFLDGVRLILKSDAAVTVVGEAMNATSLLELLAASAPDLVITDLSMGDMKGTDLVRSIKQRFPGTKVLVITMHHEQEIISEILFAEAEGYLLKNSGKKELLAAVHDILNDKTHYDKEVLDLMVAKVKNDHRQETIRKDLSERELQILKLIIREYTSKEIAEALFISKLTVDKHRMNIMEKTGAKTLVGLIKYAIAAGIAG